MKDDSLPYVYLDDDEDEGKSKKRKKRSGDAVKQKKDDLPYVYLDDDDDEPKKKKRASRSGSARENGDRRRASAEEESPRRQTGRTSNRSGAQSRTGKSSSQGGRRAGSNAPKASGGKKQSGKRGGAGTAIALLAALVLVVGVVIVALDATSVLHLGVWDAIMGNKTTENQGGSESGSTVGSGDEFNAYWLEASKDDGEQLNQSDAGAIKVTAEQLNINKNLPDEWLNILLLGTDTRVSYEASRSDTMMICSINKLTGQVKLTSIMRDTVVGMNIKGSERQEKINSAFFYGGKNYGALYAMSIVNQYFGMNIDTYVVVDFSGFAKIAEALGGLEMNISEAELTQLNHNVAEQYYLLSKTGEMGYKEAQDKYYATKLTSAGANIHLDGMQTLGYARIRKIDSDYERANRQRKVLNALLTKMRGADSATIMNLIYSNIGYVTTNMKIDSIPQLAVLVLGSKMDELEEFRLPVQGTYKEEVRNDISGLYDMNVEENKKALYNFIYGN